MNTKRIAFWAVFVIVLGLIIWGLVVAMNKPAPGATPNLGAPAPVTAADHSEGSASSTVTLIEYGDFQCPACAQYAPVVEQLYASSTSLRVVFRHFPLSQHANAMISAEASEAASAQGKFWEMYKLIYAGQQDWENQADADARVTFDGYAMSLGLDKAKFDADIDSPAVKKFILDEQAEGQALGISYTPTLFVNDKIITNPEGYAPFKAIIDAAAH